MASGGSYTFWLGASAEEADPALVASDQAAKRLDPAGVDPLRWSALHERIAQMLMGAEGDLSPCEMAYRIVEFAR